MTNDVSVIAFASLVPFISTALGDDAKSMVIG